MCYLKDFGIGIRFEITFNEHIKHILSKVNKSIGLLPKFESVLPISLLLTVYKTFIRSHLDYADIVCDQSLNCRFTKSLSQVDTMLHW